MSLGRHGDLFTHDEQRVALSRYQETISDQATQTDGTGKGTDKIELEVEPDPRRCEARGTDVSAG